MQGDAGEGGIACNDARSCSRLCNGHGIALLKQIYGNLSTEAVNEEDF